MGNGEPEPDIVTLSSDDEGEEKEDDDDAEDEEEESVSSSMVSFSKDNRPRQEDRLQELA